MKRHLSIPAAQVMTVTCLVVGLLGEPWPVAAQITPPIGDPPSVIEPPPEGYPPTVAPSAAGPYFAPPAWDQTLPPNVRFVILTNFNSNAVLDRETGLVWTRRNVIDDSGEDVFFAATAERRCKNLTVGTRAGWRLPSEAELKSVLDLSVPVGDQPRLPAGHPFFLTASTLGFVYWTSEFDTLSPDSQLAVWLEPAITLGSSPAVHKYGAWCVRGAR